MRLTDAKRAISDLFSDTSVPRSKTRSSLVELRDEIDQFLEMLKEDDRAR